jgi:hypothetical protein
VQSIRMGEERAKLRGSGNPLALRTCGFQNRIKAAVNFQMRKRKRMQDQAL